ncbi:post-GPI attachment to proteins factor 3 [Athalia rosae]|uniref:post-GPI attachment to proteins factor 3 n=1 Tax=Athalia rosae TaxID=37344 RepID=UPI0006252250|nr:post-GPI attachment to proteins factor 3 [Athalia rosae]
MSYFISCLLIVLAFIFGATCSNGDRAQFYKECLQRCNIRNCTADLEYKISPPIELKLLSWTCDDDCRYNCMWKTVEYFTSHGSRVPQFHGKWPFVRMLGLQEPASVFFSVLNFLAHFMMYKRFRKEVRPSNPMYSAWTYFSVVCMNGWMWSTVFHARDKAFTEMMDYCCAFTMVLTLLYCMLLRIAFKCYKVMAFLTGVYMIILYTHLSHLWSGNINYGYNMQFNIALGFLSFAISMIWWYRNRRILAHVTFVGWFNVLTVFVTLLEIADFPPIFWTFDAHALWHASTAPLAIILYRFIIEDCKYLQRVYEKSPLDAE